MFRLLMLPLVISASAGVTRTDFSPMTIHRTVGQTVDLNLVALSTTSAKSFTVKIGYNGVVLGATILNNVSKTYDAPGGKVTVSRSANIITISYNGTIPTQTPATLYTLTFRCNHAGTVKFKVYSNDGTDIESGDTLVVKDPLKVVAAMTP